jgi:hypothetical protein
MLIIIDPGSVAQVVIAILVCLLSIKFYTFYNPFVEDSDDILAECSQWQTFLIFFAALLIRVDATSDGKAEQAILGYTLVFILLFGFVLMQGIVAYELWLEYKGFDEAKEDEEEEEEEDDDDHCSGVGNAVSGQRSKETSAVLRSEMWSFFGVVLSGGGGSGETRPDADLESSSSASALALCDMDSPDTSVMGEAPQIVV